MQPRISLTNENNNNNNHIALPSSDITAITACTTTANASQLTVVGPDGTRDNKHYLCVDRDAIERDRLSYDLDMEREATPLISDLDELDTDHEHHTSAHAHIIHGDHSDHDVDSDTPEPFDTPLSLEQSAFDDDGMQMFPVTLTPRAVHECHDDDDENDAESDCDTDWDIDAEDDDDDDEGDDIKHESEDTTLPTLSSLPRLVLVNRSWEHATMTRVGYGASKCIKCITPITRQMAVSQIKDYSKAMRRRSVAYITPSVHRLFPLDADLLQIRDEYLQKQKQKQTQTSLSRLSSSVSSPTADVDAQCNE